MEQNSGPGNRHRLEACQCGKMSLWPGELNTQAVGGVAVTGQLYPQGCHALAAGPGTTDTTTLIWRHRDTKLDGL